MQVAGAEERTKKTHRDSDTYSVSLLAFSQLPFFAGVPVPWLPKWPRREVSVEAEPVTAQHFSLAHLVPFFGHRAKVKAGLALPLLLRIICSPPWNPSLPFWGGQCMTAEVRFARCALPTNPFSDAKFMPLAPKWPAGSLQYRKEAKVNHGKFPVSFTGSR